MSFSTNSPRRGPTSTTPASTGAPPGSPATPGSPGTASSPAPADEAPRASAGPSPSPPEAPTSSPGPSSGSGSAPPRRGPGPGGGQDPDPGMDQGVVRAGLYRAVHDQEGPGEIRVALELVYEAGLDPRREYENALASLPGLAEALPPFEEVDPESPEGTPETERPSG